MTIRPALEWLCVNEEAPLRLFCFHYAGGSSTAFRSWAGALDAPVELCAVELPGRGRLMGAKPYTRLGPLVQAAAAALLPALREKPFAFFGHSMGALVGFELSRHLAAEHGLAPQALFVSGRRAPCHPPHTAFHTLPDAELIASLAQLNGTPREVLQHPELMQLLLPVIRADFAVCETHRHHDGPPLACPIAAFGGDADPDVPVAHLAGWREHSSAGCTTSVFPGDHFYLRTAQAPLLRAVAATLGSLVSAV